ncbi:unnamed protein product [Calypogeia fissa]
MSDSDSSPSTPTLSNPPLESSKIPPSSAQPPPDGYDLHLPSLNFTASAPEAPSEILTSDGSPEIPSSDDVPPEVPPSDVPPPVSPSDIPPPIPRAEDPPEISLSPCPPPIPSSEIYPEIPPSNVPPAIPPSDDPPEIPPIPSSDIPPEVRRVSQEIPQSYLPPKIPRTHLPPRSPPPHGPPEISRSQLRPKSPPPHAPSGTAPSEVPPESSTSHIRDTLRRHSTSSVDMSTSPPEFLPESRRQSLSYQSSSFSYGSSLKPEHKYLKYTLSSPAMPYLADDNVDSSQQAKYSQRTRSSSDGSDVRWYFCKTPLRADEAAASVPSTELVGKGEYFRFSKSDSDALEAAFLEREEDLVRAWWKEYGESREGPSNANSSHDANSGEAGHISQTDRNDFDSSRRLQLNSWEEEGNVGVLVKGGLYEVDLMSRRCLPVYWRGDHRRVLRGHWYARKGGLDWLPLREDLSEQLEIAYENQIWRRRRFQPSGLYAARVNLHGATQGLHALFTGEDDSWEAWLCVDTTGISLVLGLRGSGVKLRRGFALPETPQPTQDELRQHKEEQMDDYASRVPVRHVVFMVHGIGQRLEKANLVDDVGAFRRSVAMLAEQHLTQYQRDRQRVLFIPCQWRRELKLGGESSVEDCTLEGVRALRTMLSATVHDVLYYMSPVYCQDIIDSVSRSLNRLYRKFIKRNPDFDGKVSIYGHSLGTVLSYDILCHQTFESSTSTAPIAEVLPDVDLSHKKHESDGSLSSADSIPEINQDANETSEVVSPSNSSDIKNEVSPPEDSDDSPFADNSDKMKDENKDMEITSQTKSEPQCNVESDEPLEAQHSNEAAQVHMTEVEALKAEVKMLQEKLSALMQEKSLGEKSCSSPPPGTSSQHTLGTLEDDSNKGPDGQGAGAGDPELAKKPPTADKAEAQMNNKFNSKKHFTPYISYTKLDFEVDTFFAVGSPLGVFLSLRNIRIGVGLGQEYWQDDGIEEEMPAVRQMINIFHPYDPVAYRVEPLICREYVKRRPKFIPYHKGGKRLHIGMQEFQEDLSARSKAIVNSLSSVGTRVASAFTSAPSNKTEETEANKEKTYGAKMMERLTGGPDGRLDYQLQDSTFEHPYIAVLSSHTSYWHDLDTALFILKHLYKDVPEEPPAPPAENGEVVDEKSEVPDGSIHVQAEQNPKSPEDSDPDDLPLTFSSKDTIAAVLADANKVKADWMG